MIGGRKRRPLPEAGLAFLDIMTCGFGAIILLLVVSRVGDAPSTASDPSSSGERLTLQRQLASDMEAELATLVAARLAAESEVGRRESALRASGESLTALRAQTASLQTKIEAVNSEIARGEAGGASLQRAEATLMLALQSLDEEMRRLKAQSVAAPVRDLVAGIPVDSQYIIFIVDTSGSMVRFAWDAMMNKMIETLDAYPEVSGIQVMNDMGTYMFPSTRGRFMEDTPARRRAIIKRLRRWNAYSNSSPVEGITSAIRTFYRPDRRISLYVFGDEFSGGSIQAVLDAVAALNPRGPAGTPRVRIHAVGFPVQFAAGSTQQETGIRFATLMRALTGANGGAFVGLSDYR